MTDRTINSDSRDADVLQWIFNSDAFVARFGQPVNTRFLSDALRDLSFASSKIEGNAYEVKLAWVALQDAAGAKLTGEFIASGAWKDFCPDPDADRDTESMATLWEQGDKRVVARVQFVRDAPCDLAFSVE